VVTLALVAVAATKLGDYGVDFPANLFAPTYDGWRVGPLDTCPMPNFDPAVEQPTAWDCDASLEVWLAAAREGFDRRDPGHSAVVRTTLHQNGSNARVLCNWYEVAVFELTDGTTRAIGVGHFCTDYEHISTHDYGP
jgi:hypothetical protein